MKKDKNIAFIVSSPTTLVWLESLINKLSLEYNVSVIANFNGSFLLKKELLDIVEVVTIPIVREINIFKDLKALILLFKFFSSKNFLIVHSITPKAGLLAMISSWACRTPIRIHTFTGQIWYTKSGLFRWILKCFDSVIIFFSTFIQVDSFSQKSFLVKEGLVSEKNSFVIGKGSISGVDITRFNERPSVRDKIRSDMNSEDKLIILYLGRLKKDKGILDLVEAFKILRNKSLKIDLWIVGPDEENLTPIISSVVGIKQISYTSEPEAYMTSADIFCLPSYREGFGNVIIESAACGVPSVVNEIYGLTDSVVKNKTGLFAKTRSVESLADTLEVLITDDSLRSELGRNAQKRARKDFSQKAHNDLQIDLYNKLQYEHFKGVN